MRLVSLRDTAGTLRVGAVIGENVHCFNPEEFPSMQDLIESARGGPAEPISSATSVTALDKVNLLSPLPAPSRIFCIGLNYASHAEESKMQVQKVPTVFMKLSSSVVGTETPVVLPANATDPDYEVELAVVISKSGYHIAAEDWEQYVFGYTVLNDISARGVQLATSQWTLGKSFPTFCPIGPCIVTKDEITDPHNLGISLMLNGKTVQDSNTSYLIFKIPRLIEYVSSLTPLQPGDIISTGTPAGVALGGTPPRWLQAGDVMVATVEGIGSLVNPVVAEGQEARR